MTSRLLPVASGRRIVAVMLDLGRGSGYRTAAAVVLLISGTASGLLAPPLLGAIIDGVDQRGAAGAVLLPALTLIVAAVAQGVLVVLGTINLTTAGERVLAVLREQVFARILRTPLTQIESSGHGDLVSRITTDVALVGEALRDAVPEFVRALLTIVLTFAALGILDWRLACGALVALPIYVLSSRWYLRRSAPLYADERRLEGAQQQQLLDTIGGARTIRAFRLTDQHSAMIHARSEGVAQLGLRVVRLQARFFVPLNAAELLGVAVVLIAGYWLVGQGVASTGTVSAAALYIVRLAGPIAQVLFMLDTVQNASSSLARLVGVIELPMRQADGPQQQPGDASLRAIGIGHAYVDGHPVLSDVNLTVPNGSRVAFVGASGAGKTTLAKLLAGVHSPLRGDIEIGGASLRGWPQGQVHDTVALASQEVHVFAGTLRQDLLLASPQAADEQLRGALRVVQADGWVDELTDGLDTVVGQGGTELTSVQMQQIALARILLVDRPIVLLDETTAESGSSGARLLDDATSRVLAGRTSVVVAHRLTQSAAADIVVMLHDGRIVEQGSHSDLVAAGGRYAHLWSIWSGERER